MSSPKRSATPPAPVEPENTRAARALRFISHLRALELRDAWWHAIDLFEAHRAVRRSVYASAFLLVAGGAATLWIYPWWQQRTAVSMARQWLDAGRLDHASESVQQAIKVAPLNPESWKLGADLARRLGNPASALTYSMEAARLAPGNLELVLSWASDALLADQLDETARALASLRSAVIDGSSHAQRVAGELARRREDLATAHLHFKNALNLDGPGTAINEVPLGTILINAREPAARAEGIDLLTKWTTSVEWGANTLRTLLADALARNDLVMMRTWADRLRAHPLCTLGDLPNCLLALSRSDETRFAEVLAVMEKNHERDPGNIALLLSWLNQIGRSREAIRWIHALPGALTRQPPAAVGVAEALRVVGDWPALISWTENADWGRALDPVQLSYQLKAAHETGRTELENSLWSTLQARATTDGERTLFTATTLYSWGLRDYAVTLLWTATEVPEISVNALGTLARHYQVERDAPGQYRAFKRLRSLRPRDPSVANNYALFAALTGNDPRQAEQAAKDNLASAPDNVAYRATYALVLCTQNRAPEALTLLKPVSSDWRNTPEIALAYGLALAGTRQPAEARTVFATLAPETLTSHEVAMIKRALN